MMKGPEIRIIGEASPEKKRETEEEFEKNLFSQYEALSSEQKEVLERLEYPKSEKEISLIGFANEETNRLMEEVGVEPYDIPPENYHVIPPELYKKTVYTEGKAAAFPVKQGVIFDAQYFRDNPVNFGTTAIHETLHIKGHLSVEVQEEGEEVRRTPYRMGISIQALQQHGYHGKYHQHFGGLHEAVVSEAQKRLFKKMMDQPELAEEKEWLASDEAKALKEKVAEEKNIEKDEIFWVDKNGKYNTFSYPQQREVFSYLCAEIQKEFPDKYESADDVFKEFLKAHFTGRLLPIARLVETAFGKGSFRALSNMGKSEESGTLHLESLKKTRLKELKKRQG